MGDTRVKICGLRTAGDVAAVARAGAAYAGFVFFPKSPRHLSIPEAKALALAVPTGLAKVALVVNAQDFALEAILAEVPIDMLQLHGAETPERVAEVRGDQRKFGPERHGSRRRGRQDIGRNLEPAQRSFFFVMPFCKRGPKR